jgi:hypothetical protein
MFAFSYLVSRIDMGVNAVAKTSWRLLTFFIRVSKKDKFASGVRIEIIIPSRFKCLVKNRISMPSVSCKLRPIHSYVPVIFATWGNFW